MEKKGVSLVLALAASLAVLAAGPATAAAHDDYEHEHHDHDDGGEGGGGIGDLALAVDVDYGLPVDSIGDSGGGFGIRAGLQLHVPLLVITPEVGFTYHGFDGTGEPSVTRGILGMRLGLGEIFRFGVAGHVGLAHLSADVIGPDPSHTGFAYDAGLFFDLTLLPLFDIGVHAVYNHLTEDELKPSFAWLTFGAHLALIL